MAATSEEAAARPPASRPPATQPKPPDLDARVVKIVKEAAGLYKNARSMHVEAEVNTTVKDGKDERKIEITTAVDLTRPNHFALRSRNAKDAADGLEVVCDGAILSTHSRRRKQYTEAKAPADLAAIGRALTRFGHPATGMLFQNVLSEDPDETLLDDVTSCTYLGQEKVGAANAHRVKLKQPAFECEMWIAAEGKPFVLKVVTRLASDTVNMVTVETYRNWRVDHEPDDAIFKFVPPADVNKVKAFQ
jgi:hypothetical protein